MRDDGRRDRNVSGRRPDKPHSGRPPSGRGGRPHRSGRRVSGPRDPHTAVLYGWHTVKAALENPQRRFRRIIATDAVIKRLTDDGIRFPIDPAQASTDNITAITGADAVHQGLYAEADLLDEPELEDVASGGIVLALDQITDPHNFGAILRSAAAFAVKAVVTTERHSPQSSGVLAKAASGALEYVPIVTVVNLARALDELRELGSFLVGLDSDGETDLAAMPLSAPLTLVVGAEGKGLRHLTRARCDTIARLAMPGRIASLNVSNATAVALHVASTKITKI